MTQRIGIYTGTFDPIHAGHIAFGEQAAYQCGLDAVLFIPEKTPRRKPQASDISRRLIDTRQAIAGRTIFHATTLSAQSFNVTETLAELQLLYPDAELTFLFGSDIIRTSISHWGNLGQLLNVASLAIGLRGTDTADDMERRIVRLEQAHALDIKRTYIRTPQAHVSSSYIRNTTSYKIKNS